MDIFFVFNLSAVSITFIFLVVFYAIVATVVFIFLKFDKQRMARGENIAFKSNRVYIVNTKDETVDFFDLNNLKKIETISYIEFLSNFTDVKQNRVRNFIKQILNSDSDFFDSSRTFVTNINVLIGKKKFQNRAIIFVKEIKRDEGIVYIEIYRLTHTPLETKITRKGVFHDVYEPSVIRKLYNENRFSHGTFFVLKFSYKSNAVPFINNSVIFRQVIDSLYTFLSNSQSYFFVIQDEQECCILDERYLTEFQISNLSSELMKTIDMYLEINGLSSIFDYYVGCAKSSDLPHGFDDAFNAMNGLVHGGSSVNRKYSFYRPNNDRNFSVESIYEVETKRIVNEGDFGVNYSPIVHLTNSKSQLSGYFARVVPNSKLIQHYFDAVKYASEFGLKKELISITMGNIIPSFTSQCENLGNVKLLIRSRVEDIEASIEAIKNLPKVENVKITFIVRSYEFLDKDKNEKLFELIKNIKKLGYDIGLFIKQTDYVLSEKTYKIFDCFLVDLTLDSNMKVDSMSFIKGQSLLRKLCEFGKPIVSVGAVNFQDMEYLSKIGIRYFTNDFIGKECKMLLPIDAKIIKKLNTMVK